MNLRVLVFSIIAVFVSMLGGVIQAEAKAGVLGFIGIVNQSSHTADIAARRCGLWDLAAALALRRCAPEMAVVAVVLPSTVVYPGLFASLQRPGGSVTGSSHFGEDLAVKRLELLRETIPGL